MGAASGQLDPDGRTIYNRRIENTARREIRHDSRFAECDTVVGSNQANISDTEDDTMFKTRDGMIRVISATAAVTALTIV